MSSFNSRSIEIDEIELGSLGNEGALLEEEELEEDEDELALGSVFLPFSSTTIFPGEESLRASPEGSDKSVLPSFFGLPAPFKSDKDVVRPSCLSTGFQGGRLEFFLSIDASSIDGWVRWKSEDLK